jgi:(2Fe-2S) ferredoxin
MAFHKPTNHILVCNSFRLTGAAQGTCTRKDAPSLAQYLEDEISERGIDALVSTTGCLKMCEKGPVMVVYPAGAWYGAVDEATIDAVLDALEGGLDVPALRLDCAS